QMAPDPAEFGLVDGPTFAEFHYSFMDSLAALPGVESVGLVNTLPLDEGAGTVRVSTQRASSNGEPEPLVRCTFAGADHFRTMGIQLLSGSGFDRRSTPTPEVNVMVSRAAADLLWPGENPLGQVLRPAGVDTAAFNWLVVGGVVEDVMLSDFRQANPDPMI